MVLIVVVDGGLKLEVVVVVGSSVVGAALDVCVVIWVKVEVWELIED